jgi:small-conductance mechanosensitive channel
MSEEKEEELKYSKNEIFWIRSLYIIFIIIWIIIVAYFRLYTQGIVLILFLPPIIFLIAAANIQHMNHSSANDIFAVTFIFVGIVFALPLLKWLSNKEHVDFNFISHIIVLAIMLLMISYIHICVSPEFSRIWRHGRSCLEIMAVILFIYVLSMYFVKPTEEVYW